MSIDSVGFCAFLDANQLFCVLPDASVLECAFRPGMKRRRDSLTQTWTTVDPSQVGLSAWIHGVERIGEAPQPILLDEIVVFHFQDHRSFGGLHRGLGL